jgi:hypothetical protein
MIEQFTLIRFAELAEHTNACRHALSPLDVCGVLYCVFPPQLEKFTIYLNTCTSRSHRTLHPSKTQDISSSVDPHPEEVAAL